LWPYDSRLAPGVSGRLQQSASCVFIASRAASADDTAQLQLHQRPVPTCQLAQAPVRQRAHLVQVAEDGKPPWTGRPGGCCGVWCTGLLLQKRGRGEGGALGRGWQLGAAHHAIVEGSSTLGRQAKTWLLLFLFVRKGRDGRGCLQTRVELR
jgi:hypothetical protein